MSIKFFRLKDTKKRRKNLNRAIHTKKRLMVDGKEWHFIYMFSPTAISSTLLHNLILIRLMKKRSRSNSNFHATNKYLCYREFSSEEFSLSFSSISIMKSWISTYSHAYIELIVTLDDIKQNLNFLFLTFLSC